MAGAVDFITSSPRARIMQDKSAETTGVIETFPTNLYTDAYNPPAAGG